MTSSPSKPLSLLRIVTISLSLHLVSCTAGVDPTEDPVQPSQGNEDNEEANNENSANSGNAGLDTDDEKDLANKDALGAATNNAADEDFGNATASKSGGSNNLFGNGDNNNNLLGNNKGNGNGGTGGEDALVNNAEAEDILTSQPPAANNQGVVDLGPPPGAETQAPKATNGPRGGGFVRYVLAGGSALRANPNGKVVRKLEQGDHPLVSEDGEWSRTSDGYYAPARDLTPQPVGRLKPSRPWR